MRVAAFPPSPPIRVQAVNYPPSLRRQDRADPVANQSS